MATDRTVTVRIAADIGQYQAAMLAAGASTTTLAEAMDKANKAATDQDLNKRAAGASKAGTAAQGAAAAEQQLAGAEQKTTASTTAATQATDKASQSRKTSAKATEDSVAPTTALGKSEEELGRKASGASGGVTQLGGSLNRAMDTEKGRANLDKVTTSAALVGAGLAAVAVGAITMEAKFDSAMSQVKANVDDKGVASMNALRSAALQAGQDTQFSAIEAADAEDELAKAGVSAKDIIGGGLTGALSLAAAGQINVGDAAEIAASAMNNFRLSGSAIPHIADLLAAGADKAQGSVQDLGEALKFVGPVAGSMGISIESTVGVLTEFASQGIKGSMAGTELRGVIGALTSPSQQASAEMSKLGINLYDAQGKFVGLAAMAGQLHDKLGGLTGAEQDAALGMIFGNQQVTAARVLMEGGAKGVQDYTKAVDDQGFAVQSAGTKMNNLAGDVKKLGSSLQNDLIKAGSGANSALRDMTEHLTGAVNAFGQLPSGVQTAGVWIAGLTGMVVLAGAGFVKARTGLASLRAEMESLGPAGEKAGRALSSVAGYAGRIGLILTGFQIASAALGSDITVQIDSLQRSLESFAKSGRVAGTAAEILGKNMSTFKQDIKSFKTGELAQITTGFSQVMESISGMGQVMDDSVYHAHERIGQLDQALAGLVTSGHADEAKEAFVKLLVATKAAGGNINDLKAALPQYEAAVGNLSQAQANSATATQKAADAAHLLAGSWQAAVNAGKSLKDTFDALNGKAVSAEQALVQVSSGEAALTKSFQDNGMSMDINTDAGRQNMTAVLNLSGAVRDAVQAKYEETGSIETANGVYNTYIGQLRNTLGQAGLTKAQIDQLIASYFAMPKYVQTAVAAPGAVTSTNQVYGLLNAENSLYDKTITILTQYLTSGSPGPSTQQGGIGTLLSPNRWGGVYPAATGLLRDATIMPGGRPLYQWAEPGTGGEAFVPRLGDTARSRAIIQTAASWYGGQAVWAGAAPVARPAAVTSGGGGPSAEAIGAAVAARLAGPLGELAASRAGPMRLQFQRGGLATAVEQDQRYRTNTG